MIKILFALSIVVVFGGEITMWLGSSHVNMSLASAGFTLYVPALLSTFLFGALAWASEMRNNIPC